MARKCMKLSKRRSLSRCRRLGAAVDLDVKCGQGCILKNLLCTKQAFLSNTREISHAPIPLDVSHSCSGMT
jgi:hypothetical protein